jgi:3-hydroxyacyl-[acyl-carrier-protein] dehydratase
MLLNTFYTIEYTESSEDSFRTGLLLNTEHQIYAVHFPGNPITPGVCLLQMALELLDLKFERRLRLIQAKSIKYLKVINPLQNPKIEFNFKYIIENDLILTDINITAGEEIFTRISATFKGL